MDTWTQIVVAAPTPTWTAAGEDKPVQAAKIETVLNWTVTADTGQCMRDGVELLHRTTTLEAGGHSLTFRKPDEQAWKIACAWISTAGTVGALDKAVMDFLSATLAHYSYPSVAQIGRPSRHLAAAKIIDLWNDNRPPVVGVAQAAAEIAGAGSVAGMFARILESMTAGFLQLPAQAEKRPEVEHRVTFPNGIVHRHATERAARASAQAIHGAVYEQRETTDVEQPPPRQPRVLTLAGTTALILWNLCMLALILWLTDGLVGIALALAVSAVTVGLPTEASHRKRRHAATRTAPVVEAPKPVEADPHAVLGTWFSPHAMCPACKSTDVHALNPNHTGAGIGRRCVCGHRWTQRASYDG